MARMKYQVCRAFKGLGIKNGKCFLERVDRGPKDFLCDLSPCIFGRKFLVKFGRRQAIVVVERRRKSLNPANPSFLTILTIIASETPASSAIDLSGVARSKSRRPRIMSTTRASSGVRWGIIIRMRGPTVLGSVKDDVIPGPLSRGRSAWRQE